MRSDAKPENASRAMHVILVMIGALMLAIFSVSLIQLLSTFLDYYLGFVAIGAVVAGWSMSSALDHCVQSGIISGRHSYSPAVYLVCSGIAATGVLLTLFLFPPDYSAGFILLTILIAAFFLCGMRGLTLMARQAMPHATGRRIALLSGLSGLMISPLLIDIAHGPLAMAWATAIGMTLIGVITAFRTTWFLLSGGALFALLSGAYVLQWNPYALPSMTIKPLASVRIDGVAPVKSVTRWDSGMRADAMENREADRTIRWIYSDLNAPVPVPVIYGDRAEAASWLRERFPLVAFPFLVKQTRNALAVVPAPGPETVMASSLGIARFHVLAYDRAAKDFTSLPMGMAQGDFQGNVVYGNVPRVLAEDRRSYDFIYTSVTHLARAGGIGSSLSESGLYTKEAFEGYLSHLAPDGLLAVTVSDDLLFIKLILTINEIQNRRADVENERKTMLWGARFVGRATVQDPYRYLLIVTRDPDVAAAMSRLSVEMNASSVEFLFGPGVNPRQRQIFSVLQQPVPVEKIQQVMMDYFSQRAGKQLDLRPATSLRPFFFQILDDVHPWLKSLLAVCIFTLLGCMLFPQSRRRGLQFPDSGERPPLPLYLGCFAALGAVASMLASGAVVRLSMVMGSSAWACVVVLAAMLTGLTGAWEIAVKHVERSHWIWLNLAVFLLVGVLHAVTTYSSGIFDQLPGAGAGIVMLCILLPLAVCFGTVLQHGVRWQKQVLPELIPWAWVVFGLAGVSGIVVVQWISQLWGWGTAWLVMAATVLLILGLGLWIWNPRYCRNTGMTES